MMVYHESETWLGFALLLQTHILISQAGINIGVSSRKNFPLNNIKKTQMIALNTYEKGRKEEILVHKHLVLLFTSLALLSTSSSLAELVRKSGLLAQVLSWGGEVGGKRICPKVFSLHFFSPVHPDIVLQRRGLAMLSSDTESQHGSLETHLPPLRTAIATTSQSLLAVVRPSPVLYSFFVFKYFFKHMDVSPIPSAKTCSFVFLEPQRYDK